jgi:hypothetical protein
LAPCPFCGQEATLFGGNGKAVSIGCDTEGCIGNVHSTWYDAESAAEAWNAALRVPSPPPTPSTAAITEAVAICEATDARTARERGQDAAETGYYELRRIIWRLRDAASAGAPLDRETATLRKLLWLRHGCVIATLYGDDGEMQCAACGIDFKRASAEEIERIWREKGLARLADGKETPK